MGEAYLVVGDRRIDDLYVAPPCGNTVPLRLAAEAGHFKALERARRDGSFGHDRAGLGHYAVLGYCVGIL